MSEKITMPKNVQAFVDKYGGIGSKEQDSAFWKEFRKAANAYANVQAKRICDLEHALAEEKKHRNKIEDNLRVDLRGYPDSELWGDAGLIAATMRCVDALDIITEQRDKALQKIKNQAERIAYLEGATNHATGTPLSKAIEQRDRLAEALENCREDSIELLGERDWWQLENRGDYQQRYQTTRDNVTHADAALQSLIKP